ncbi:[Protein-PII] uridylyltransferase [Sterolibacterium denitrificans]|uniref:Bifunctional uridylyltransferase/uridylyl-removing enzyme n=1 Tax=Sterolibacterium denitrificans TaxID=157592 RepID=A0A7Z7MV13_9PROT|nr:[protein-PII] uridylyltransferase [Sterolibacterium denitrificans]SMB25667.1 [Protein-PII] uridylyltransferase [Sterolibacterium denitrificans]
MPDQPSGTATGKRILALRQRLQDGQAALHQDYLAKGNASAMLRGRARLVDGLLRELWRHCAPPQAMALVAVGGYGRGELYPASDIDLLILLPDDDCRQADEEITPLIGMLWDIGLEVGHSVRSSADCLLEAARDISVQTNLLEARLVAGNRQTFAGFAQAMHDQLDIRQFFKAKRLEQQERHARFDDTAFSLEPNCKESPGGLRDLQVILWIARAAGLGRRWRDLTAHALITASEARQLERCERLLDHLRIRLHYLARRREDRLLFDHQEALAEAFGIRPSAAKRASELLMQRYYLNARLINQLGTLLLQNLGEHLFPAYHRHLAPIYINPRFQMQRDLLDVRDEQIFEREPRAILESFLLLQQRSELKGMTARTLRALWRARSHIDAKFRRDPGNRALFLSMFQQKRGIVHEMRRMNHYDILGRYLPAFGRIVGQMQHDLFHVYTVDQHILQVLRNLRRFSLPEFAHEYPRCSRLMSRFERHWLIYIAALFHDIAKGRGGDHSQLGMRDARRFCIEHGLAEEDTDLVGFLVGDHLTMSAVAQKQDLADPEVIAAFARTVQTRRRLDALYLLTVADIRGTSPKVWNNWKGKLLEDLYLATRRLLDGKTDRQASDGDGRQDEVRRLLRFHGLRPGMEAALWQQLDTAYFMRHAADEIAWHTRNLYHCPNAPLPVVKARLHQIDDGLQVMVYVADQPLLFARLCGFFSRLGYSIVDARIHTTRHGYALDSFTLLDPGRQLPYRDMTGLIEHDLVEHLRAMPPLAAVQPNATRLSRQLRHFPIMPEISIHPDDKGRYHIMSIVAADRPGLLYSVALTLAHHRVSVHTARIATLGERAEDTFLISGEKLLQPASRMRLEQELLEILQI